MLNNKKRFEIMIIIIFVIIISSMTFANSIKNIPEAHQESLKLYKDGKVKGAIKVLEDNGIQNIIEAIPQNITEDIYVLILNNYGFYLSETEDRYEEALSILERVIEISPKRSVAYLNIGDTYLKIYQENNDESLKEKVKENYNKYLSLLKEDANIPYKVRKFLMDEAFEKAMEEIRKSEYDIKKYSTAKNFEEDYFKDFLYDFKSGQNIEFIEPILVTDDINNKELRQYFKNDIEFIEEVITFEESSPTMKYRSKFNYKLYHIDFDNNFENGKEYLFYTGGYIDIWGGGMQSNNDFYFLLDFEEKKIRDVAIVYNTIDYNNKKLTNNFNGVIKYKGRFFIYEVRETNYSIVLWSWDNNYEYIPVLLSFYLKREADN